MIKVTSKLHHILESLSMIGVELTLTQKMVFDCTAIGMTQEEIAEELSVSTETVKKARHSVFKKTGFKDQRDIMQTVIDSLQRKVEGNEKGNNKHN